MDKQQSPQIYEALTKLKEDIKQLAQYTNFNNEHLD